MCAVFCLLLSFSFIRPKPSRLFLHPSLLPQHNSKRMCVVVPSGLLCPNKPTAPLPNPAPLLRQRLRKPPTPLLVVTSVPCSSDNCWDVWSSHLCSVLFLSLTPCRSPFQKSLLQLFLSLNIKKKKVIVCEIFAHFFLSPTPVCSFSLVHSRFIWLDKRSRKVIDRKKAKETG